MIIWRGDFDGSGRINSHKFLYNHELKDLENCDDKESNVKNEPISDTVDEYNTF